jgi:hypothetical protein
LAASRQQEQRQEAAQAQQLFREGDRETLIHFGIVYHLVEN